MIRQGVNASIIAAQTIGPRCYKDWINIAARIDPERLRRARCARFCTIMTAEDVLATPEKIEKARKLLRDGMSMKQVSKEVGLAESTLYRDIPGGAAGFLDEPVNDVDLPETPT